MKPDLNAPVIVILGHYGSGKTNLTLNLARDLRGLSERLTVVDLDIVNPYFRSTDNADMLTELDIEVLGPTYGASNLDTPSLQPGIDNAIREAGSNHRVILDVGGDPDGAKALARFAPSFAEAHAVEVVAVINQARPDTRTVEQNLELIAQIEAVGKIKITALVGNTHLKEFTTPEIIVEQLLVLNRLSQELVLPVLFVMVPRSLLSEVDNRIARLPAQQRPRLYAVDQLVRTVWE